MVVPQGEMTPEDVRDSWSTICDFASATHPDSTQSSMEPIMAATMSAAAAPSAPSMPKSDNVDVAVALAHPATRTHSCLCLCLSALARVGLCFCVSV